MRLQALLVSLVAALGACSAEANGCGDFDPVSAPIEVGESIDVTVEIVNGGWSTPDIAGAYWSTEATVPTELGNTASLEGSAKLTEASFTDDGELLSGRLVVDLNEVVGPIEFTGPLGCD